MAFRSENMDQVQKFGDQLPIGSYHFRVSRVEDDGKIIHIHSTIQNEPYVGRSIRDRFDLTQRPAIEKLKSYYEACEYKPGPEGHDPEQILGAEFYACVTHNIDKGTTYANITPWSIRSLQDGPTQPLGEFEERKR